MVVFSGTLLLPTFNKAVLTLKSGNQKGFSCEDGIVKFGHYVILFKEYIFVYIIQNEVSEKRLDD